MNEQVDPGKVQEWGDAKTGSRISQNAVDYMSRAAREMVIDELSELIEAGATPTQAVDIWATEIAGVEMGDYYPEAELTPETCFEIIYWEVSWE